MKVKKLLFVVFMAMLFFVLSTVGVSAIENDGNIGADKASITEEEHLSNVDENPDQKNDLEENELADETKLDVNVEEASSEIIGNKKDNVGTQKEQEIEISSDSSVNEYELTQDSTLKTSNQKTGWQTEHGSRYYYKSDGSVYKNTCATIEGKVYYFGIDGQLLYGVNKYNDKYYYSDNNGVVKTTGGWISENGERKYYASKDGSLIQNNQIDTCGKVNQRFFYFANNCKLVKGVYKNPQKGNWYYADVNTGGIRTDAGFVDWNGSRYYVIKGGALACGGQKELGKQVNQRFYYFANDCKLVKGVYKNPQKGNWYYADAKTGGIRTDAGFVDWNNGRYYVKQGGSLYRNQFIHSVDSNGTKRYYYVGSNCRVNVGKFTLNGVTYTTDDRGLINEEVVLQGTKGIDVSEFQGIIDWAKVKAAGIKFAFIRVGGRYYGSGGMYNDSYFVTNIRGAIAAGINVGVYYFTQAINNSEALEEALYTLKKISGYNISMPVVIDTESTPNGRHNKISVSTRTNVVKTFCDRIKSAGYTPMIYASTSWLNNQLNMSALSDYLVWVAQYYHKVTYQGSYKCWQYTSSGKVNGIKGNVDMDYWYGSNDSLIVE